MLTGLLGVLLAASIGSPGPHVVSPEEICFLRDRCSTGPVLCLADPGGCGPVEDVTICYVSRCPEPGPVLTPRGRGSSR